MCKTEHFIQSSYNHLKQIDKSVIILISPVKIYTRCHPSLTHLSLSLAERINPIFLFDIIYTFVIATSIIYLGVAVLWLKYCEDSLKHQTINQSMNIYICMPVIDSVVSRIFPIKLNFFFTSPQTWTAKFYISYTILTSALLRILAQGEVHVLFS